MTEQLNQVETYIHVEETSRNKKTVFWRGVLAFPIVVFISSFTPMAHWGWGLSGIVVVPALLAILFRGVYPSYILEFNHEIIELQTRALAYIFLLNDDYPSIEGHSRVTVSFPDVEGGAALNRGLPLVKWFLAIPLYIVGAIYSIAAIVVTFVAWISTSITGEYPLWAQQIVVGTIEFWNRVSGYAILLVTDEYPTFSL
jgi:hypothetical protein